MRTERSTSIGNAQTYARFRRRVEKPSAASGLGREERRGTKPATTNSPARESVAPSHFETRRRATDFESLPVSGFAAQLIGQMLRPERNAAAQGARAYAQAKAASQGQRPLKYA